MVKKEMRLFVGIVTLLFGLYIWGEIKGFKLFKEESGATWSSTENPYGAVHHK